MKNILLLICCFMTYTAVHCMELDVLDESNINGETTEKILINDCKIALKKNLEKYKTNDDFTPQDMDNIFGVISYMTNGSENSMDYVHLTKDDELNGFFQYALKKIDLPGMKWLIEKGNIKHHSEKECASFVAFCSEQLLPTADQSKRDTAYAILKSVIEHYKTAPVFQACKDYYLQIMVMLQLKHRTSETKFIIEEEVLIPFLQQNPVQNMNGLSHMYQTVVNDEENNTLAHIVVEQHDADELHKLMNKNYISKEAKNNIHKTVHELAFDKFRTFTQDTSLITKSPEESQKVRCCYFMLEKYFAENDFDKKKNCCEKHPVLKRYGADLLKQSPSASLSPSASTSISSSSELLASLEKPELILADEPESNCCMRLLDRCIKRNKVIRF